MPRKPEKTFIKVVYFDEGSATDFIHIMEGGKPEERSEKIIEKTTQLAAKAAASANASMKFFGFFQANAEGGGGTGFSREGTSVMKKAIENTILTDYLTLAGMKKHSYIKTFSDCTLFPYPDSFAYFKMLTPFLIMTDGTIDAGELKLNPSKMDMALESGRGYYELMVQYEEKLSVLRFNIKAFRNNYSIADLVKMNLDFHAMEVGKVGLSMLTMQSEFSDKKVEVNGFNLVNETHSESECTVYDVILAGVRK